MNSDRNELIVEAFLTNEDKVNIRNPLHSTEGAGQYNFEGALVTGVDVWGWSIPLVLNVIGREWLDLGWAEFSFKKPTHPGDKLKIALEKNSDNEEFDLTMVNQKNITCVIGKVGLGKAVWSDDFLISNLIKDDNFASEKFEITEDNLIKKPNWLTKTLDTNPTMARDFSLEKQRNSDALFINNIPKLHPAWIAAWPEDLMRHNFSVPYSIHTRSHLQFLKSIDAGATVTGGAHLIDVYKRHGYEYVNFDVLLQDDFGDHVAMLRHWTIFKIVKPGND